MKFNLFSIKIPAQRVTMMCLEKQRKFKYHKFNSGEVPLDQNYISFQLVCRYLALAYVKLTGKFLLYLSKMWFKLKGMQKITEFNTPILKVSKLRLRMLIMTCTSHRTGQQYWDSYATLLTPSLCLCCYTQAVIRKNKDMETQGQGGSVSFIIIHNHDFF